MQRKKLVHQLDTPFSTVQWPSISQEDQDIILELLCDLLAPLGQYRQDHVKISKGKRVRAQELKKSDPPPPPRVESPPAPELAAYVDVGLANVSRVLESICSGEERGGTEKDQDDAIKSAAKDFSPTYSAIFVVRSGHPPAFHSHFPQMVGVASKSHPAREPIRLVGLSKACEDRLSACLGISRASTIALRANAPQSQALVDFVLNHVPPAEVLWLKEGQEGVHMSTKINSTTTTIGTKQPRIK